MYYQSTSLFCKKAVEDTEKKFSKNKYFNSGKNIRLIPIKHKMAEPQTPPFYS